MLIKIIVTLNNYTYICTMTLKQLNKLIAESGLMQKHIALKLDISRGHLNRVIKGKSPLTKDICTKLSSFLSK